MENKKNASQRLDDVETVLSHTSHTLDMMARDLMILKEAVKLLGNKADAVAKAANLSDDQISKLMIENNIEELKQKTIQMIAQGILDDTDVAAEDSFIIGQEVGDDGSVVNPRIQFALSALGQPLKDKLLGAKAGDLVSLEEGKLKLLITELYKIQSPKLTQEDSVPAESVEAAPATPAAQAIVDVVPTQSESEQAT